MSEDSWVLVDEECSMKDLVAVEDGNIAKGTRNKNNANNDADAPVQDACTVPNVMQFIEMIYGTNYSELQTKMNEMMASVTSASYSTFVKLKDDINEAIADIRNTFADEDIDQLIHRDHERNGMDY